MGGYLMGVGKQKSIQTVPPSERISSRLIYEDSFESTQVLWTAAAGDEVTHETGIAGIHVGGDGKKDHVLKIVDASGADATAALALGRVFGKLKMDFWFRQEASATTIALRFYIFVFDGAVRHRCQFSYLAGANKKWQYSGSGGETDVIGGAQDLINEDWHHVTIEYDHVNDEFISFQCDNVKVDMAGIASTVTTPDTATPKTSISAIIDSTGTNNQYMALDGFKLFEVLS